MKCSTGRAGGGGGGGSELKVSTWCSTFLALETHEFTASLAKHKSLLSELAFGIIQSNPGLSVRAIPLGVVLGNLS